MAEGGEGGGKAAPGTVSVDMDAMIDEILAKKGPQTYKDGLSEQNWEEEMERIPLFMTKNPTSIDPEKDTALSALQQLKYEMSTAEGRGLAHKEEGNELFKKKKYKLAVKEYSAGIKEKSEDDTLNAVLYSNRAAAQYHLGNYRSSITDATQAKKLKPDHIKALIRGALACDKLQHYGEAIQWCDEGLRVRDGHCHWCDEGLRVDSENTTLKELRVKATKEKKKQERDKRKQDVVEKSKHSQEQKILAAIKSRGIRLHSDDVRKGIPHLTLEGPHPTAEPVHFDDQDQLVWPVLMMYPEYGQSDFIACFNENEKFYDHIAVMFSADQQPPWNSERVYTPSTIELYFENDLLGGLTQVPLKSTLAQALSSPGYRVREGTPSFIILAAKTAFRTKYLERT